MHRGHAHLPQQLTAFGVGTPDIAYNSMFHAVLKKSRV
jgi:hypothetical protein